LKNGPPDAREHQTTAGPADRWQQEAARNLQRLKNFSVLMADPGAPAVGSTPREEIYRRGAARLYRYTSARTRQVPLLFIPNLGLSRPYIFDLMPGMSFVEYMTREGFDFYLLDWGTFGPEDSDLTLEECLTRTLPRAVRKVLETSGADRLSLLGYCMGGTLAACYLGLTPEGPVANLVNMAGPIDFGHTGLFGRWLDRRFFDADKVADTFGELPVAMIKAGMQLLKPTMELTSRLNLWWNLWNADYVEGYRALNRWANEYVSMPGEFFRAWIKAFYQDNRLIRGELQCGERVARLGAIRCPVLAVAAQEDHICPPGAVQALISAVGSDDTQYLELPGGHISLIAGRSASAHCWPRILNWLAARS